MSRWREWGETTSVPAPSKGKKKRSHLIDCSIEQPTRPSELRVPVSCATKGRSCNDQIHTCVGIRRAVCLGPDGGDHGRERAGKSPLEDAERVRQPAAAPRHFGCAFRKERRAVVRRQARDQVL